MLLRFAYLKRGFEKIYKIQRQLVVLFENLYDISSVEILSAIKQRGVH